MDLQRSQAMSLTHIPTLNKLGARNYQTQVADNGLTFGSQLPFLSNVSHFALSIPQRDVLLSFSIHFLIG
jgi:hypothetical protein